MSKCCGKNRKHNYSVVNGEDRAFEWCPSCGSFQTIITGFLTDCEVENLEDY